jgi:hypothetical protein
MKTEKTPGYMLSTAQDDRKEYGGDQQRNACVVNFVCNLDGLSFG